MRAALLAVALRFESGARQKWGKNLLPEFRRCVNAHEPLIC